MAQVDSWPQPTLDQLRAHIDELAERHQAIHDGHVAMAIEHYAKRGDDDSADAPGQ